MIGSKEDERYIKYCAAVVSIATGFIMLFKIPVPGFFVIMFGILMIPVIWDFLSIFVDENYLAIWKFAAPTICIVLAVDISIACIEKPPVQNTEAYISYIDRQAMEEEDMPSMDEVRDDVEYIREHIISFAFDSSVMEQLLERSARLKYYAARNDSVLLSDIAINTRAAVEDIYTRKQTIVNNELIKKILSDCDMYLS